MSLSVGDLVAYLGIDASEWNDGLDEAEGGLKKFGGKAKLLAAAAGVAAAGALAGGLAGAMNVEASNDKLAAQLGLTPAESQRIGGIAGKLYAGAYGENLDQVNEAIKGVVQNVSGMSTASSADLQAVTTKVLDLNSAFGQDLGATTAAVGQLIKTGLVKDATEGLDIITKGLQGPANKADDLLDTFNEYGTQFRKLGLDGKDSLGLLGQGLQGGARDADLVADAFKEFSLRSLSSLEQFDSKGRPKLTAVGQAFETLGLNGHKAQDAIAAGGPGAKTALTQVLDALRNVEDPLTRATTATSLFGTQAEDLGGALFALDLNTAAKGLGQVDGAAARMGATLNDNASANLESFKRQIQTTFVGFVGGKALPVVSDFAAALATGLGPAIQGVTGFFSDHQIAMQIVFGVVIAGFAAWGVAATIAAARNVAAWVSAAVAAEGSSAVQALSSAQVVLRWAVQAAAATAGGLAVAAAWLMSIAPIALVIAAVVGLVVVVVKNWDTIKRVIVGAAQAVLGFLRNNWPLILAILTGPFGLAVLMIVRHWNDIMAFITGLPGKISNAAHGMWDGIADAFKAAINVIVDFWNGLEFKIPGFHIGPVGYDGFTLGVPDIPRAAEGAIIRSTVGGVNMGSFRAGEAGRDEAVVPLPAGGATGLWDMSELVDEVKALRAELRDMPRRLELAKRGDG